MPNKQYVAGRALEYLVMKEWETKSYSAIRASGSHGEFDLIAFRPDRKPEMVQCKRVSTEAEAKRLIKQFISDTKPSSFYHQTLTVKIKGSTDLINHTI